MKPTRLLRIFLHIFCLLAVLSPAFAEPVHPRLLFGPDDVPALRDRAQQEPFASMLEAVEFMRDHDPFFTEDGQDQFHKDFGNPAIMYLFTGEQEWADLARDETLYYISRTEWWANSSYSALRRGALSRGASISYDFCYHAWAGQTVPATVTYRGQTRSLPGGYVGRPVNEVVSEAILANAQSLMASGGPGWPGGERYGNNWYAVRYSGAGIGFLATDESFNEGSLTTAINEVVKYLETTLTQREDAQGWNPEGHGYAMFPGQYTYLFDLLLQRHRDRSLGDTVPAFNKQLWGIFQGGLPYPVLDYPNESGRANLGFHPDFTDDNVNWNGEGTANLAFVHSPPEFVPGLKWVYRRVFGDLGDNTWDASSMGGLYALLFYPHDIQEENPADIPGWGLWYYDPSFGMTLMRNRFEDENDALVMFNGKFRSAEGGHNAPDGLSFRIAGEGHLWTTGSGRTTNPRGQTNVFTGDPEGGAGDSSVYAERFGTPREVYLREGGGGIVSFNAFRSDTGVRGQTRRIVTDFDDHITGATSVVLVEDQTADGEYWRLNTPGSNTITLRSDGFEIESLDGPEGPRLIGRILHGDASTLRTGTFARGSENFFFRGETYPENNWVDFRSDNGYFLVALMLLPAGAEEQTSIDWSASEADTVVVQVNGTPARTYHFTEETVTVSGWERPDIQITSPADGAEFIGGTASFTLSGTASHPNGVVDVIEIYQDEVFIGNAVYNSGDETWTFPVEINELGDYHFHARAIDEELDYRDSNAMLVRVTTSLPPRLKFTNIAPQTAIPAGQRVHLAGTVFDEDGVIISVEVYNHDQFVGNAIEDTSTGTWSYTWNNFPFGRHAIRVRAEDNDGDVTWTDPLPVTGSLRFHPEPHEGDAANWSSGHLNQRWRVVSDGSDLRYYLGPVGPNEQRYSENRILDRPMNDEFRFEYRFKSDKPLSEAPQYKIFFGENLWVRMTTEVAADGDSGGGWPLTHRLGQNNAFTQVQQADAQHQRWIAYAHGAGIQHEGWHDVVVERKGNHLMISVDGQEILNTEAPDTVFVSGDLNDTPDIEPGINYVYTPRQDTIALTGKVGVGNFFNSDSQHGWFDDFKLIAPNAPPRPEVTFSQAGTAQVVPVDQPVTLSGSFSHADDRPTTLEIFAGSERVGTTTPVNGSWSLEWTPTHSADYALRVRAVDNRLEEMWTDPAHFRVTASGSETLSPPQITLLQPVAPLTVPQGAGAVIEVSGAQGSAPLSHVSLYRDGGIWAADAVRAGSQTRWIADLPTGETGPVVFTPRLYDGLGQFVELPPITVTVEERTAATPIHVNFQPEDLPAASGYYADSALDFGDRGHNLSYGWSGTSAAHERNALTAPDRRYATGVIGSEWQLALDPGFYEVRVVSGNPAASGSITSGLFVQGQAVYTALPQAAGVSRDDTLPSVEVSGGHLTIRANPDGQSGQTMGLYFVEVTPIDGGNLPPLISWESPATDTDFPLGTSVTLTVEAEDVDGSVTGVEFFAGGSPIGTGTQTQGTNLWTLTWTPDASLEGFVFLTARATDNEGATRLTDPALRIIIGEVTNQPPVALFTSDPNFGDAPLPVNFNAGASYDPDGEIVSYHWDFGDGETGSGVTATHTFQTPDIYEVILTVTDNGGATAQHSGFITVTDPDAGGSSITIMAQPAGGSVAPGQTLPLSVEAIGQGPLVFEWYEGPVGDIANSTLHYVDGGGSTNGGLLAYDGIEFGDGPGDYEAGQGLHGKNPDLSGWTGAWSGAADNRPLTVFGTMEYNDAFGNELQVTGGRIRQGTTMSNNPVRSFDTSAEGPLADIVDGNKIAAGRVFLSHLLLWERDTGFIFGLQDGGNLRTWLFQDGSDGNAWKIQVGNEVRTLTEEFPANITHLIVWEVDFDAGVTRFYLNPTLSDTAPQAMFEINEAFAFDRFRMAGGREYEVDEIRLGTSFAAVTPYLSPAMPTTSTWTPPALTEDTTFWVRVHNAVAEVSSEGAHITVAGDSDPYTAWASDLPDGQRGQMDDPYATGMPNIFRFALGMAANEHPAAHHNPPLVADGDLMHISWPVRDGVNYVVQGSTDLDGWDSLTSVIPQASVSQSAPEDGMTQVSVHVPTAPILFIRLAVPVDTSNHAGDQ